MSVVSNENPIKIVASDLDGHPIGTGSQAQCFLEENAKRAACKGKLLYLCNLGRHHVDVAEYSRVWVSQLI